MKKIALSLLLLTPFFTLAQLPVPGNDKAVPVDQYELALVIAAVIMTLVVAFIATKRLKKA